MNWKDIGGLIGKAAPLVGGVLGGPLGAAAGGIIADALGVPAEPASVAKALQSDPAAMAKVIEVQSAERVRLAELAAQTVEAEQTRIVDLARIDFEDRASARTREADTHDTVTPRAIAGLVIVGFFGSVGYVLSGSVGLNGEQGILVGTLVGYVSAKADQVLSYYFGSSASSAQKTNLLARSTLDKP